VQQYTPELVFRVLSLSVDDVKRQRTFSSLRPRSATSCPKVRGTPTSFGTILLERVRNSVYLPVKFVVSEYVSY